MLSNTMSSTIAGYFVNLPAKMKIVQKGTEYQLNRYRKRNRFLDKQIAAAKVHFDKLEESKKKRIEELKLELEQLKRQEQQMQQEEQMQQEQQIDASKSNRFNFGNFNNSHERHQMDSTAEPNFSMFSGQTSISFNEVFKAHDAKMMAAHNSNHSDHFSQDRSGSLVGRAVPKPHLVQQDHQLPNRPLNVNMEIDQSGNRIYHSTPMLPDNRFQLPLSAPFLNAATRHRRQKSVSSRIRLFP